MLPIVSHTPARSAATRTGLAKRAADCARGEEEWKNRSEQGDGSPLDAIQRLKQPGPSRRSDHRAVRAKLVADALPATRFTNEMFALVRRHRGKIVNVKLALP